MGAVDLLLDSVIGRYRVVRLIGEGGMGLVYEGYNTEIGGRVAIKVLSGHDPELAARMAAEARAVNRIDNRHIVRALDFVVLGDGRPAIVMELVEGRSLRTVIAAGSAALGGVVDIALQVLDALAAAHAAGVIHRDLKPDNILVGDVDVKVLDFGIAKVLQEDGGHAAPRTRTGVLLGTPEYMSPEQIDGRAVDERTDLYALGVVLFEAVTGQRPFTGASDFQVLRAHVEQQPPSIRELRSDITPALADVITRALEKEPRDRFATATEMAAALRLAAQTLPDYTWRSLVTGEKLNSPVPDIGRLDVRTARPKAKPDVANAPRARRAWLAPVVAALGTAAIFGVVILMTRHGDTPVIQDAARHSVDAAIAVPVDASPPPPDASIVVQQVPAPESFPFTDRAGFVACMNSVRMTETTNADRRELSDFEIERRCVETAARMLAAKHASVTTITGFLDDVRTSRWPTGGIDLIELATHKSLAACNDSIVYDALMQIYERSMNGKEPQLPRADVAVKWCLRDATFRRDFLDEIHSDNKWLRERACTIATQQHLVTSCDPPSAP